MGQLEYLSRATPKLLYIDLISKEDSCLNECGYVIQDIRAPFVKAEVIFEFVPRNYNSVAHGLTQHGFLDSKSES